MLFQKRLISLFILVVFTASRFLVLVGSADLYDFEETRMGLFAKELLSGPVIPYTALATSHEAHQLGELLNGVFIAVFYAIFDEKGAVLKLLWFFLSLATFLVFFLISRRFFGFKTALFASSLFILSPPFFTWSNLTDAGAESGALLLIMLMTFFSLKALPFKEGDPLPPLFYGFLLGLSALYSHYCFIILPVFVIYQLWLNPSFFKKKEALFLFFSFFAGLAPFFLINALYDMDSFKYIWGGLNTAAFHPNGLIGAMIAVPHSLCFGDIWMLRGELLNYVYCGISVSVFLLFIFSGRREKNKVLFNTLQPQAAFIMFFFALYILAFVFFDSGKINPDSEAPRLYRHLVAAYPFLFIMLAFFINGIIEKGSAGLRRAGYLSLSALCLLGLFGNTSMVDLERNNFKLAAAYPPYSLTWLPYRIYAFAERHGGITECLIDEIEKIRAAAGTGFLRGGGDRKGVQAGTFFT